MVPRTHNAALDTTHSGDNNNISPQIKHLIDKKMLNAGYVKVASSLNKTVWSPVLIVLKCYIPTEALDPDSGVATTGYLTSGLFPKQHAD